MAGVLLGKTRLDWLYGQMNGSGRTVSQFVPADSRQWRARLGLAKKIVVFPVVGAGTAG
jgi:hypothetical protein